MTPESQAKKDLYKVIEDACKRLGMTFTFDTNAAGGYGGTKGLPDRTYFFYQPNWPINIAVKIEVKATDNTPTLLQSKHLTKFHTTGGHGLVIWGDDPEELKFIEHFLANLARLAPTLKLEKGKVYV